MLFDAVCTTIAAVHDCVAGAWLPPTENAVAMNYLRRTAHERTKLSASVVLMHVAYIVQVLHVYDPNVHYSLYSVTKDIRYVFTVMPSLIGHYT